MCSDDLSLDAFLAKDAKTEFTQRAALVRKVLRGNAKTYLTNKTIARKTGLTVNQVYHVLNKHPELRELRASRK